MEEWKFRVQMWLQNTMQGVQADDRLVSSFRIADPKKMQPRQLQEHQIKQSMKTLTHFIKNRKLSRNNFIQRTLHGLKEQEEKGLEVMHAFELDQLTGQEFRKVLAQ